MRVFVFSFLMMSCLFVKGQAGLTTSPVKFYFEVSPGGRDSQVITISNPTNMEVEVGVSFGDWNYDIDGTNQIHEPGTLKTSCADWIKVLPSSYFVLQPKERKKLEIVMAVPPDANTNIPVHNCLLFFTQLNPGHGGYDENGAAILVTVKMGVKIYHSFFKDMPAEIEIVGFDTFKDKEGELGISLFLENTGKSWTNGKVAWELFNKNTGEKEKLEKSDFYTLPGDKRRVEPELPENLKPGDYTLTAILEYGDNNEALKVAELAFFVE